MLVLIIRRFLINAICYVNKINDNLMGKWMELELSILIKDKLETKLEISLLEVNDFLKKE